MLLKQALGEHCERSASSHEIVVAVNHIQVRLIEHFKLHTVPHQTTNATKSLAKLVSLLGFVGDELKFCTVVLVVFDYPLNEYNVFNYVELDSALRIAVELFVFFPRHVSSRTPLPCLCGDYGS